MKKILSTFILSVALFATCIFVSCNTDSENNDSDTKETTEQLNKFEVGWWYVHETSRYVDNNTKEESLETNRYLINYGSDGKATGDYFGEFSESSSEFERESWNNDESEYNESWFIPMNYKLVCKYITKEFSRKDKEDGVIYTKYKLEKSNSDDEEFPSWAKK
ncbi:MAG: hypothetical protein UIB61_08820 [Treponema sp.]|nr:hypothetical protein [Treponema sp.]